MNGGGKQRYERDGRRQARLAELPSRTGSSLSDTQTAKHLFFLLWVIQGAERIRFQRRLAETGKWIGQANPWPSQLERMALGVWPDKWACEGEVCLSVVLYTRVGSVVPARRRVSGSTGGARHALRPQPRRDIGQASAVHGRGRRDAQFVRAHTGLMEKGWARQRFSKATPP